MSDLESGAPEYSSVESFVEYMISAELDIFNHLDLLELGRNLRTSPSKLRKVLEGYGLKLAVREPPKQVRGFKTSSHDRWFGPGSCKTHGGAGGPSINGFATQAGYSMEGDALG
jgi:hypothetical protein